MSNCIPVVKELGKLLQEPESSGVGPRSELVEDQQGTYPVMLAFTMDLVTLVSFLTQLEVEP